MTRKHHEHREYRDSSRPMMRELRGHRTWKKWHKAVLVQLDLMGLRHLLSADLRSMSGAEHYEYVTDQKRAVQLVVRNVSEPVLQRLWNCGWELPGATINNTLALLADLLAEPEQHAQQTYETHRDLVDLARIELSPTSPTNGFAQFATDAQQCHLRLLARYGGGNGSVEELLEHLFTSSVMEGMRASRPDEHAEWMQALDEGRRAPFVSQLVALIREPRLDAMGSRRQHGDDSDGRVPSKGPRGWDRQEWESRRARQAARRRSRAAWGLRTHVPRHMRYRGTDYPDRYAPRYEKEDDHERSRTVDEIL
ncbi:hypothetical protein PWT90_10294 [Aphanocladium album]|nr:hypothetical protein PWT90_10294 [Aphanocladium album]